MKRVTKNIIFISALALLSHNTAFAQTTLYAEAPVATGPTFSSVTPQAQAPQYDQLDVNAAQVIDLNADAVTLDKTLWQDKTQNESRWILKPEASSNDAAIAPKNYAQDFTGLRPSVLGDNDAKIGTYTQYSKAGQQPYLNANRTSDQNLYSKTDDNFLLRAKLDF